MQPRSVQRHTLRRRALRGFTLVELMIVMAVIGIVVAMSGPSVDSMMRAIGVHSASSALSVDLAFARAEAVRTHGVVTVCARQDDTTCGSNWRNGWLVFRGANPADATSMLRVQEPTSDRITLTESSAANAIVFRASGTTTGAFLWQVRASGQPGRDIAVSMVGRVATSTP